MARGFSLCCVTLGVTHFAFQKLCLYQTSVFIYTSTVIALKTSHGYQLYKNKQKIHNQIWTFLSLETKSCIHMKCIREIFKRRKLYDCSATSSPHNANSLLSWSRPCWPNWTLHVGTYQCSLLIWFGLVCFTTSQLLAGVHIHPADAKILQQTLQNKCQHLLEIVNKRSEVLFVFP